MSPVWRLAGVGLVAGAAIAYVDNVAFGGEVSPVAIVVMLLATTVATAGLWGRRGTIAAAAAWMCVPLAHLVKHVLGLPDTLYPNTYGSIIRLAIFTFLVAGVGTGAGLLIRRVIAALVGRGGQPT